MGLCNSPLCRRVALQTGFSPLAGMAHAIGVSVEGEFLQTGFSPLAGMGLCNQQGLIIDSTIQGVSVPLRGWVFVT